MVHSCFVGKTGSQTCIQAPAIPLWEDKNVSLIVNEHPKFHYLRPVFPPSLSSFLPSFFPPSLPSSLRASFKNQENCSPTSRFLILEWKVSDGACWNQGAVRFPSKSPVYEVSQTPRCQTERYLPCPALLLFRLVYWNGSIFQLVFLPDIFNSLFSYITVTIHTEKCTHGKSRLPEFSV